MKLLRWGFALLLALSPVSLFGHGGRTDALGCHYNRKAGGYHCHSGPLAGQSFATKADALAALNSKSDAASKAGSRSTAAPGATLSGNPDRRVWVNTSSGVYHCPGTRWYGATKAGTYMTQKEAQQQRNRPAYGRACD